MSSSESTIAPESPIKSGFLPLDLDKMTARNELRVTNTEQVFNVLSAHASVTQSKQMIVTLKFWFVPPERLSRSLLLLVNKEFLDHVRGALALGEALLRSPFVADKGSVYFVMVLLRAVLDRAGKFLLDL
jgi:hypothetical protein